MPTLREQIEAAGVGDPQWGVLDRKAVLTIIDNFEARLDHIRREAAQRDKEDGGAYWLGYANGVEAAQEEVSGDD